MEQVRMAGNLGDTPLIVLASSGQRSLARLSTRGRTVLLEREVTGAAIIGAIREMVAR